ncbi:hypothetical protein MNJPNG_18830 [Cupriavidus oxalaticus]|uniref:hypothetical protein n=1 Tax=Cupriavidus oxalaticus TaxID=96344 RepID=UPI003F740E96
MANRSAGPGGRARQRPGQDSKLCLVGLYVLYFVALQVVYQQWFASAYAYFGYVDNFGWPEFMVALPMLVVLVLATRNDETPSSIFLHLAIGFILVPSLVVYAGQSASDEFLLLTFGAFLILIASARLLRLRRIVFPRVPRNTMLLLSFYISFLTILGIVAYEGLQFLNFDFARVYDIRREAEESLPGIFGYLNSIVTKVVIPFGLALSLLQKRWALAAVFFLMSGAFFALTANKAPLFSPLAVLFFYFASGSPHLKRYFLLIVLGGVMLSGVDFWRIEHAGAESWFGDLFTRRALLVPSWLNLLYVEHFSGLEKYYWAHSKFSFGLVQSPHELEASRMIGYVYFHNADMSANTGWIGSGFANAGFLGVALYSFVIGAVLSLLDAYARQLSARIVVALFVLPILVVMTSSDLISLLTNGLAVALFLLLAFDPESARTGPRPSRKAAGQGHADHAARSA